jgi:hypothetical protein
LQRIIETKADKEGDRSSKYKINGKTSWRSISNPRSLANETPPTKINRVISLSSTNLECGFSTFLIFSSWTASAWLTLGVRTIIVNDLPSG